ncbi:MAG: hypothetical protein MAG794_00349 [Gammaproteobacteria bacterium]|nr:hypothetical protein [Gammaproteobacteria bacterium]
MSQVHRVDVFFYGSYMNRSVLAKARIDERPCEPVRLPGYLLAIEPWANLVPDTASQAFGILTQVSHAELNRLYTTPSRRKKKKRVSKKRGRYSPEAVLVFDNANVLMPALCYVSHDMTFAVPDPGYVDRILEPAREYGFPVDYLEHIESFK